MVKVPTRAISVVSIESTPEAGSKEKGLVVVSTDKPDSFALKVAARVGPQ